MNTRKLSAVLTAALLTGAVSATAFAAEPVNLVDTDASIIFKKAISLENAIGSGGVRGTINFDVTPAETGDLPTNPEDGAQVGTVAQIKTGTASATFAVDATGKADTEQDVTVEFDLTQFSEPGVYYYRLTEQDHRIAGLSVAPTYLLKARVVNANTDDPDGTGFKIDYAVLAPLAGGDKVDEIVNDYTTHGLTLTKHLDGDFVNYNDVFDFTLSFTDPNYVDDETDAPMASVTVRTGTEGGTLGNETVLQFDKGKASITEHIKGGEMIEVTGLPAGVTYTIEEKGSAADKYTAAWTNAAGTTLSTDKTLEDQKTTTSDTALVVTNTRNAPTPTGLLMDAAPYGAMLALAAGSGAVFFRKRRNGQ